VEKERNEQDEQCRARHEGHDSVTPKCCLH
jgi:hypothetical protein